MAKVAVFIADGSEEVEAITPVDLLRRAKAEVDIVSIMPSLEIEASRGLKIKADKLIGDIDFDDYDFLILPGGVKGIGQPIFLDQRPGAYGALPLLCDGHGHGVGRPVDQIGRGDLGPLVGTQPLLAPVPPAVQQVVKAPSVVPEKGHAVAHPGPEAGMKVEGHGPVKG